ncbi:ABC transporter ATP-binding protein [Enterococcus alcedinis]
MKLWYQREPKLIIYLFLESLLIVAMPYVLIYFSAKILNELGNQRRVEELVKWIVWTLVVESVLGILKEVVRYQKMKYQGMSSLLNSEFYVDKMLTMDYQKFATSHIHDLRTQIKESENWTGVGLLRVLKITEEIFQSILGILGGVLLTFSLFTSVVTTTSDELIWLNHPLLVAILFILSILGTMLPPFFMNKSGEYWIRLASESRDGNRFGMFFSYYMNQSDRGLDVRMYEQDKITEQYILEHNVYQDRNSLFAQYSRGGIGIFRSLAAISSVIFSGFVYLYVCLKAWGGAFGVGSVTQYIGAILSLANHVSKFVEAIGSTQTNAEFLQVNFELLDQPNELYQGTLTTEKRSDRNYSIEFCNVSFKYPDSDTFVLKNISLKFEIGKRIAIVGENGSGKTTFIKLLCRLYDPTEGEIRLNGIDIRKYNYTDYLNLFSVVFQDFKLLSLTIGENVAANREYEEEKVKLALDESGFSERLDHSPEGLKSYLYKDFNPAGIEISGGEAQKIAIARALYKDAPFMILDEPTASLDPIAEEEIYQKFNQIVSDKTAVYISHRLSSCRFCDEILVFDKGEIIQRGHHNELVNQSKEKYSELWTAQAQYYQ